MSPDAQALRALSQFLVADASLGDALQRVATLACQAVPAADVAGVSMRGADGRPTTAVYTDEKSPRIERAEYEAGRGPCLDAWREQKPVRLDDIQLAQDDYPEFCQAAAEHGMSSTLSLPLAANGQPLGALNFYAGEKAAFSEREEELGSDFALAASALVANSGAYWDAWELSEHMASAMRSRAVIEQAKGFLMAQSPGLDAEAAFTLLRLASQRENVKLRDLARDIVERRRPIGSAE